MMLFGRSGVAVACLTGVLIAGAAPAVQALQRARAEDGAALRLQPALLVAAAGAGQRAALFVHAPAFTHLDLALAYPGGATARYQGTADGHGRYVFSWTVPDALRLSGTARLQLTGQRGGQSGSWSGALQVRAAVPPPLHIQPLATRILAGTSVAVFVSTRPNTPFAYTLRAGGGPVIARGTARADALGRYVLRVPEPYLPRHAVTLVATITVATAAGARTASAPMTLLPRPPLPLTLIIPRDAVRAGRPLTVLVASRPGTSISLAVMLQATPLARGSGITDGTGRWRFQATLSVSLARATEARILVQASRGIDHAGGHAAFLLQPGRPGIVDHLATAANPTPDLSRFFTQIPDRVILVSAATTGQTLRAYDHGALVHEDYVTTGRPELPTPPGVYHVMAKYSPYEMISPWPPGSAFYYPPSWTHFAMLFREGGYFLHDAPWRAVYGPGTNLPHASDPGEPIGTHGCINLPYMDMVWLWTWAPIGTTVVVY